ncbi:ATP-binding protein [candidate division KSB1 bacterium]|nr:ATP-binding protein [candidate division KSB1 bacterium]MBL7094105.1 ATP-binding protein [candidate division KSB1 bacterium]
MNISESEHIEFKKSLTQLKSSLKSIAAILNKHNKGELFFGLKDDGIPIKNTYSEKTLRDISQTISHKIEPKIYPNIAFVEFNSIKVIKVTFEGFDVPYSADGRYYLRVADEDKLLSSAELRKIVLDNQDVTLG